MALRADNVIFQRIRASATLAGGSTALSDTVNVSDADTILYYLDVGTSTATAELDVNLQTGSHGAVLDNLSVSKDADIELDKTTNTELGFSFTTPDHGGVRVDTVRAWCYKEGAPTGNITCTIQADSEGEPDDTDLFTPIAVAVAGIATAADGGTPVTFNLAAPLDLAADTTYWVVLEGSWTGSTTANIHVYVDTVATGGNAMIHTTDWQSAVTTQVGAVEVLGVDFTDVATAEFATVGPDNDNTVYVMEVPCAQNDPDARQRLKAVATTEATVFGLHAVKEVKLRPGSQTNAAVVGTL